MLKVVFFDAAGTLFTTRRPVGDSYAVVARDFGANVSGKAVSAAFRRAFSSAHGLAFGPGRSTEELRRLEREWWRERVAETFSQLHQFDDFQAYFDTLFEFFGDPANWVAYPDVAPALEELKRSGLQLGVISNFDARLYRLLEGLDLARFFDSVIISSEAGYAKPAVELFEFALARSGVRPSEALHAGDAAHLDVAGANAAGIEALLVRRPEEGGSAKAPEPLPYAVVFSFAEIVSIARRRLIT
jgi:putative hydrolase of the HAD superfamily